MGMPLRTGRNGENAVREACKAFIVKEKDPEFLQSLYGAENETRTRDPDLGKVVLYQLSYFRINQF